jgi:hypothetical protein
VGKRVWQVAFLHWKCRLLCRAAVSQAWLSVHSAVVPIPQKADAAGLPVPLDSLRKRVRRTTGPLDVLFLPPWKDKCDPHGALHPDLKSMSTRGSELPVGGTPSGGWNQTSSPHTLLQWQGNGGAAAAVFLNLFSLTALRT